ncbi:MAG TPA: GNAT family N-acetyltransferase [Thermoplasmata archaeon]|nr:GNAT family N-acetyltransferase [Thermoplasmata archaeon]
MGFAKHSDSDPYFLLTERLGFRCWSLADLPLARSLWGDARVTRLIGGPFSPEAIQDRLGREIETMRLHGVQYWPLFFLPTGEFVGAAGLRPDDGEPRIYELGVHLRPAFWGQGLAAEAGGAVIRYAFERLQARGLVAGHHPENAASGRVLEKLGFRRVGLKFYPPTGLDHPSYRLDPP